MVTMGGIAAQNSTKNNFVRTYVIYLLMRILRYSSSQQAQCSYLPSFTGRR